jgi:hypothetical protein
MVDSPDTQTVMKSVVQEGVEWSGAVSLPVVDPWMRTAAAPSRPAMSIALAVAALAAAFGIALWIDLRHRP